jgi:uncharacterized DUF497 family protein
MASFLFEFDWDPVKAHTNFVRHGVDFERAAEVFRDPLALTIPDEEHSITEVRWITMGKDTHGRSLLVVHTFDPIDGQTARIRLISARRPTRGELRVYEEQE